MSALLMHLAKWIPALGPVTESHLVNKAVKIRKVYQRTMGVSLLYLALIDSSLLVQNEVSQRSMLRHRFRKCFWYKWLKKYVGAFLNAYCPLSFLIFLNGTWPSGSHRHSAKWYPGVFTRQVTLFYNTIVGVITSQVMKEDDEPVTRRILIKRSWIADGAKILNVGH